jgi:hypothetical protein
LSSCAGLSGMSVAPKTTVLAWICLMPPPEADRLVVQSGAGLFLVGVGPLRIESDRGRWRRRRRCPRRGRARWSRRRSRRLRSVCGKVSMLSPVGRDENGSRRRACANGSDHDVPGYGRWGLTWLHARGWPVWYVQWRSIPRLPASLRVPCHRSMIAP